jgi:hypothetical protein
MTKLGLGNGVILGVVAGAGEAEEHADDAAPDEFHGGNEAFHAGHVRGDRLGGVGVFAAQLFERNDLVDRQLQPPGYVFVDARQ